MKGPLVLNYRLDEELWRRFYEAHYQADPSLKVRYGWGIACIVIGALGFAGAYHPLVAALLLLTGLYGVLSRQLFMVKSVAAARKHPYFGQEITVLVSTDGVAVRSADAAYRQDWNQFTGWRKVAPGTILYMGRNFFFIPKSALDAGEEARLEELLRAIPKKQ